MSIFEQVRRRVVHELKVGLAGEDLDALVLRRDRRRLRWIAEEGEDPVVRLRALRHLAEMMAVEVAPLFITAIEAPAGDLPALQVRVAAEGLGRLQHRPALPALKRLLGADRPASVRLAAARALAGVGGAEAWKAVRAFCQDAEGETPLLPDLRDTCVPEEAGPLGTRSAALVFQVHFADQDGRWWAQKAANWLKGQEDEPRVAANRGADKAVAALLRNSLEKRGLDDETFGFTVLHLGTLARERDGDLLAGLLSEHREGPRHRSLIQALGLQADPSTVLRLGTPVGAASPSDVVDLARALGRLGWPSAAVPLGALRGKARDPAARIEIAWALGECGGEEAVKQLVAAARSDETPADDVELAWIGRSLKRCGGPGREAVRGALSIARAAGGERQRLQRVAEAGKIR